MSHQASRACVSEPETPTLMMAEPLPQGCQSLLMTEVSDALRRAERALDEGLDYFQIEGDKSRRARSTDPETSHTAAKNAERFAATHAGRIHAALKAHGPRTAHELSLLIGLSVVQIDRRTVELQRAKLIDVVLLSDSGLKVVDGFRVWRAV